VPSDLLQLIERVCVSFPVQEAPGSVQDPIDHEYVHPLKSETVWFSAGFVAALQRLFATTAPSRSRLQPTVLV
jgi:hypothetical protein